MHGSVSVKSSWTRGSSFYDVLRFQQRSQEYRETNEESARTSNTMFSARSKAHQATQPTSKPATQPTSKVPYPRQDAFHKHPASKMLLRPKSVPVTPPTAAVPTKKAPTKRTIPRGSVLEAASSSGSTRAPVSPIVPPPPPPPPPIHHTEPMLTMPCRQYRMRMQDAHELGEMQGTAVGRREGARKERLEAIKRAQDANKAAIAKAAGTREEKNKGGCGNAKRTISSNTH